MSNLKTTKVILFQDNTQLVEIQGLQDIVTGNYLNAATVSITLLDENSAQVPGCIGVVLNYEPTSNGYYSGLVTVSLDPPIGGGYRLIVDADQSGAHLHLEIPAEVRARTS